MARKLRLVPRGVGSIPGYFLIICCGYGLFYLVADIDAFVIRPARFQQVNLGEQVAWPTSLVGLEAGGFQDPYMEWRYRLSPTQANALRPRCTTRLRGDGSRVCMLFSAMDERRLAEVTLEGNEFRILDALH